MNQFCLVPWGQMFEFMFCKFSSWLQKIYSPGPHFSKFFLSAVFRLLSDQHPSQSPENCLNLFHLPLFCHTFAWIFPSFLLYDTCGCFFLLFRVWALASVTAQREQQSQSPASWFWLCVTVVILCQAQEQQGKALSSSLTWHVLNPQRMYLLKFNKALLEKDLRVLQEQALLIVASLSSLLSWCRISSAVLQHGGTSNSFKK